MSSENGIGKRRLTASERESLLRLNVALEILMREPDTLAARAALVPGAKRDLGLLRAKIKTLMEGFTHTIPTEQLISYRNTLRMTSYIIGARRPGSRGRDWTNYGLWLSYEEINGLLEGCHDKCLTCALDTVGRRKCPLRKTLDAIPNDVSERADGDCPYFAML